MRRDPCDVSPTRATGLVYRRAGSFSVAIAAETSCVATTGERPDSASPSPLGSPGDVNSRDDKHPDREPRLLIVDDCTLYREYLAAVFGSDGAAAPALAWDLESLLTALTESRPSLVLLNLDTRDSAMLLHATFEICPNPKVIVLGMDEDDETGIVACAEAGVAGYHLRTDSIGALLELIRLVSER